MRPVQPLVGYRPRGEGPDRPELQTQAPLAPGVAPTMYQSPRMRRLRNDLAALERLQAESSVFRFTTQGDPPQVYRIMFRGRGLWRERGKVKMLEKHHV